MDLQIDYTGISAVLISRGRCESIVIACLRFRSDISSRREALVDGTLFDCHVEGSIGSIDLSNAETVQEWGPVIAHVTKRKIGVCRHGLG